MNDEHTEEDFAKLFEQSMNEGRQSFEPGQLIETKIVSISGGCVFLQLGGKSEGLIDAEELKDADGKLTIRAGDDIKAYFHSAKDGELLFTTKIRGEKAGNAILETAFQNRIPVEGHIEKEIKGGYQVNIGDARAFCPYSQITFNRADAPEDLIGTKQMFRITEYAEKGRNLLVSRRVLLEEARNEKLEELKKTLKENMTVTGTVSSIQDYGAFVEIGVIRALLPISEISRERISDVKEVLSVGQEIEASIIKLDWKNERISLSMKALLADPWDTITEHYSVGSTYEGKVARITNFGAFVTLEPGLDGLIHISDLPGDDRDGREVKPIQQGQSIDVQINRIDAERRRLSLKLVTSEKVDKAFSDYMEPESDTYNPFAELLKDRSKKK